ncbi:MAG TPA: metallophosphoesterase [Candidatus Polarisedimenticolaceae bacterium]|nr:metallophosphoesterase [Candidatus Polarisedimenticolaceae bacterium]
MRWVVGDVHGCARELDDLLRATRFDAARDTLWTIGDLVNTGPDSVAVLRLWRDLGGRGVIGNHDVYALLSTSGRWPVKEDQLKALRKDPERDALLEPLRRLPLLQHFPAQGSGGEAWLVHAGLHPDWTDLQKVALRTAGPPFDDDRLESADLHFGTRVRCCALDGERVRFTGLPEQCPPGTRPWDAFYRGSALIVHGHWGKRGAYRTERVLGLDSGCVYGGRLTAWCAEEDRTVSVPSRGRT